MHVPMNLRATFDKEDQVSKRNKPVPRQAVVSPMNTTPYGGETIGYLSASPRPKPRIFQVK